MNTTKMPELEPSPAQINEAVRVHFAHDILFDLYATHRFESLDSKGAEIADVEAKRIATWMAPNWDRYEPATLAETIRQVVQRDAGRAETSAL